MRCIETKIFYDLKFLRFGIKSNMRCIETKQIPSELHAHPGIKSNMRCIETNKKIRFILELA